MRVRVADLDAFLEQQRVQPGSLGHLSGGGANYEPRTST